VGDPHLEQTWATIQERLRAVLPESVFRAWISDLEPVGLERSTLYLRSSGDTQEWIRRRFGSLVAEVAVSTYPQLHRVEFVRSRDDIPAGREGTSGGPNPDSEAQLDPELTFGSFVIGDCNRFAHAAALAVAEMPASAYNPLLVQGPSGTGKTHLLHAIGHYVRRHDSAILVHYATAETFTNEFVGALRSDCVDHFKRRYRRCNVLLLDDIHFLEGKDRTAEELSHTLDAVLGSGAQLVISTSSHPSQLTTLARRMRERLEAGLAVDLALPDVSTQLAILQRLSALASGSKLDPAVLDLVARHAGPNVRTLRAAFTRLIAFASLTATTPSLTATQELLTQLSPLRTESTPFSHKPSTLRIQQAVCSSLDLDRKQLLSPSRSRHLVYARQLAMYLCRELTDLSLPAIAASFGGKDHTTVLHAHRKIQRQALTDPRLRAELTHLTSALTGPSTPLPQEAPSSP
jgi:chromosomal replication initiator protein